MSEINAFQISPHFSLKEFQCACCRCVKLDPRLVHILENVRAHIGQPVFVTSGYRCPVHNAAVSGAEDSDHLYGWAADIVVRSMLPKSLAVVVGWFMPEGTGRIGLYPDKQCVHVGAQHRNGLPDRWGFET